MGIWDTFVDGAIDVDVKCFDADMRTFTPGDTVPVRELRLKSLREHPYFTIAIPAYCGLKPATKKFKTEGLIGRYYPWVFVIIKDGVFERIAKNLDDVIFPIISKWGKMEVRRAISVKRAKSVKKAKNGKKAKSSRRVKNGERKSVR